MDFQKKDWQFRDLISENELNRMEDGIEEGITKAEQAQDDLAAHTAATTGVHGATSAATPNTIVQRDGSGQFEVGAPTDANHVARKAELDSVIDSLNAHTGRTDNPHHTTADQVGAPSLTKIVPDGTSLNTVTTSGFYRLGINHQDAPSGVDYGQMIVSRGGDTILQIVTGFNNNEFYIRHGNPPEAGGAGVWQPWRMLWHDGNDGAGSGLDADSLDGIHAAGFVLNGSAGINGISARWDGAIRFDVDASQDLPVAKALDADTVRGYVPAKKDGETFTDDVVIDRGRNAGYTTLRIRNTTQVIDFGSFWQEGVTQFSQIQTGDAITGVPTLLRINPNGGMVSINDYVAWHAGNLPYEVGNWTPELRFSGSTTGITYASRRGRYTRIANVVYWSFEIVLSSKGSASGAAWITGLPFNKEAGLEFDHSVGRASNIALPSGQWLVSYISFATIYLNTNTGSIITDAAFANNSMITASGFYFI